MGLDYVSCSPYRVPIARVAAAQAALAGEEDAVIESGVRPPADAVSSTASPACARSRARPAHERAVADAVLAELRALGVEVAEDDAAGPARAGSGNLIARVPGAGERWVSFFAHLDTVPEPGRIEVELADGVFRSRGETILGADDKAAVAVLVELAARHARSPGGRPGSSSCSRSPRRRGCGARRSSTSSRLRAPFGYVLDHASPIGELIIAAPTYQRLVAEFEGLEAHAGIRPEAATRRSRRPPRRSRR